MANNNEVIPFQKKDKVKVIKTEGFEEFLKKGQIYTIFDIDETGIDIGFSRNFPVALFALVEPDKCDFTEERDILQDVFWSKDLEIPELEEQISKINYLQAYYGLKMEKLIKELKILELGFDTWYDKTIEEEIDKVSKQFTDPKDKKEFLKNYSTQAKERRLLTLAHSTEYEEWRKSIIEKEYEIGKLKNILKSLDTKAINLNIINKNHKEYE